MKSKIKFLLFFYLLFSVALVYIILNWPYTPQNVIDDAQKLGAWGILLDACILLPIVIWWRRRRIRKTESLIYQRNESENIGEFNG